MEICESGLQGPANKFFLAPPQPPEEFLSKMGWAFDCDQDRRQERLGRGQVVVATSPQGETVQLNDSRQLRLLEAFLGKVQAPPIQRVAEDAMRLAEAGWRYQRSGALNDCHQPVGNLLELSYAVTHRVSSGRYYRREVSLHHPSHVAHFRWPSRLLSLAPYLDRPESQLKMLAAASDEESVERDVGDFDRLVRRIGSQQAEPLMVQLTTAWNRNRFERTPLLEFVHQTLIPFAQKNQLEDRLDSLASALFWQNGSQPAEPGRRWHLVEPLWAQLPPSPKRGEAFVETVREVFGPDSPAITPAIIERLPQLVGAVADLGLSQDDQAQDWPVALTLGRELAKRGQLEQWGQRVPELAKMLPKLKQDEPAVLIRLGLQVSDTLHQLESPTAVLFEAELDAFQKVFTGLEHRLKSAPFLADPHRTVERFRAVNQRLQPGHVLHSEAMNTFLELEEQFEEVFLPLLEVAPSPERAAFIAKNVDQLKEPPANYAAHLVTLVSSGLDKPLPIYKRLLRADRGEESVDQVLDRFGQLRRVTNDAEVSVKAVEQFYRDLAETGVTSEELFDHYLQSLTLGGYDELEKARPTWERKKTIEHDLDWLLVGGHAVAIEEG